MKKISNWVFWIGVVGAVLLPFPISLIPAGFAALSWTKAIKTED